MWPHEGVEAALGSEHPEPRRHRGGKWRAARAKEMSAAKQLPVCGSVVPAPRGLGRDDKVPGVARAPPPTRPPARLARHRPRSRLQSSRVARPPWSSCVFLAPLRVRLPRRGRAPLHVRPPHACERQPAFLFFFLVSLELNLAAPRSALTIIMAGISLPFAFGSGFPTVWDRDGSHGTAAPAAAAGGWSQSRSHPSPRVGRGP